MMITRQSVLTMSDELPRGKVVPFDQPLENNLKQVLQYTAQLEEEVRALREALYRSERAVAQRDRLLQNALERELELRAELVRQMH